MSASFSRSDGNVSVSDVSCEGRGPPAAPPSPLPAPVVATSSTGALCRARYLKHGQVCVHVCVRVPGLHSKLGSRVQRLLRCRVVCVCVCACVCVCVRACSVQHVSPTWRVSPQPTRTGRTGSGSRRPRPAGAVSGRSRPSCRGRGANAGGGTTRAAAAHSASPACRAHHRSREALRLRTRIGERIVTCVRHVMCAVACACCHVCVCHVFVSRVHVMCSCHVTTT